MSKRIHVTPKKGLVVRDPLTREPLPEAGAEVDSGQYWTRRKLDGDVTIAPAKKSKA